MTHDFETVDDLRKWYSPEKARRRLRSLGHLYDGASREPWRLRMLGYAIDETFGLQQLIIMDINATKVYWHDLPPFVKQRARDKGMAPWMLTREGGV